MPVPLLRNLLSVISFCTAVLAVPKVSAEILPALVPPVSCAERLTDLIAKQLPIQRELCRSRDLGIYERHFIFKPYLDENPNWGPNGVARYLREITGAASLEKLDWVKMISAISKSRHEPVQWLELGGGLQIPQREIARAKLLSSEQLEMTHMDLFDWPNDPRMNKTDLLILKKRFGENIFSPEFAPRFINADAQTFLSSKKFDIITAIVMHMYLPDEIAGIKNWYNHLKDSGFMIIADEKPLNNKIIDFLSSLRRKEINFTYSGLYNQNGAEIKSSLDIQILLIEKKPGTSL